MTGAGALNSFEVVGTYQAFASFDHGYIEMGKKFKTVEPPGSLSSFLNGVNDHGVAVGGYCNTVGCNPASGQYGFIFDHGKFITIDPMPGSGTTYAAEGINNLGQVVGGYCPASPQCPDGIGLSSFGFLLDHGVFTTINFPDSQGSQAYAINDAGDIAGDYNIHNAGPNGFLYSQGAYTTIDVPHAVFTFVTGINNAGTISGSYEDQQLNVHGFTYHNGVYTSFDVPGAVETSFTGIDNRGRVVADASFTSEPQPYVGIPTAQGLAWQPRDGPAGSDAP